jgi:hypothetical protein
VLEVESITRKVLKGHINTKKVLEADFVPTVVIERRWDCVDDNGQLRDTNGVLEQLFLLACCKLLNWYFLCRFCPMVIEKSSILPSSGGAFVDDSGKLRNRN